ncbi:MULTISPECIES: alpha/beta hydrolase family protein [unclassified Agrobacterium]
MKTIALLSAFTAFPAIALAQPADQASYESRYIRLSDDTEGLLLQPKTPNPNAHVAFVFSHPNRDNFKELPGPAIASHGYTVMLVNYRGDRDNPDAPPEDFLPSISDGIAKLRTLPGIDKVVLLAHSGGTHMGTLYENVAEHGPAACQGPEKIVPCDGEKIGKLEKPDALILLDPTLGAAHQMSAVDPAGGGEKRDASLDMFAKENGYDIEGKKATYTPEFAGAFFTAQAKRNDAIVDAALERLKLIEAGKGEFANDEPFVVKGVGIRALGARLYQPDLSFAAHTKRPHMLLKADGTRPVEVIKSVRPSAGGKQVLKMLDELGAMNYSTTVRGFLANSAIRASADYAFAADDITGIDWASSYTSTPANAEGVSVPALVLTMSCHYLVVPGEVIYNRLGSKDKTYASVEGATHLFQPCRPEYGDTKRRVFDFVDEWVSKPGRL